MQSNNRILDDLAKVANGAVSTLSGVKGEIEVGVRHQLERLLMDMDLVARDEFEVMKEVAITARTEQQKLEKRIAELEAQLANPPANTRKKKSAKPAGAKSTKK